MRLVNIIIRYLSEKKIIEDEDLEWVRYGLEKRLSGGITSTIFLILAIKLSNIYVAFAYLGSFYFLRARINGYHAKTFIGCLFVSIFLEVTMLKTILPLLNRNLVIALNIVSFSIILAWAPFNDPNLHLSSRELQGCKRSARIRVLILLTFEIVFFVLHKQQLINGITLGNTMAAFLMAIAIIRKGEVQNESHLGKNGENSSKENGQPRYEKMAS